MLTSQFLNKRADIMANMRSLRSKLFRLNEFQKEHVKDRSVAMENSEAIETIFNQLTEINKELETLLPKIQNDL